jgi:hypothetical protein
VDLKTRYHCGYVLEEIFFEYLFKLCQEAIATQTKKLSDNFALVSNHVRPSLGSMDKTLK